MNDDEPQTDLDPQAEDLDPEHLEKFLQDSRLFFEPFLDTEV